MPLPNDTIKKQKSGFTWDEHHLLQFSEFQLHKFRLTPLDSEVYNLYPLCLVCGGAAGPQMRVTTEHVSLLSSSQDSTRAPPGQGLQDPLVKVAQQRH